LWEDSLSLLEEEEEEEDILGEAGDGEGGGESWWLVGDWVGVLVAGCGTR
jgi:hypothetical protein